MGKILGIRKFNFSLFIFFVLLSQGCALTTWTQLKGMVYKDGARRFEAEMPEGWMRLNAGNYFLITKDGVLLNRITVERVLLNKKLEFTKKVFAEGMSAFELSEVEVDNMKANPEYTRFQLISNKPQEADGRDGFRLEYFYVSKNLDVHGIHQGFIYDKWAYRIRYEAADRHYFDKYKKDFERFIETFRIF